MRNDGTGYVDGDRRPEAALQIGQREIVVIDDDACPRMERIVEIHGVNVKRRARAGRKGTSGYEKIEGLPAIRPQNVDHILSGASGEGASVDRQIPRVFSRADNTACGIFEIESEKSDIMRPADRDHSVSGGETVIACGIVHVKRSRVFVDPEFSL